MDIRPKLAAIYSIHFRQLGLLTHQEVLNSSSVPYVEMPVTMEFLAFGNACSLRSPDSMRNSFILSAALGLKDFYLGVRS